MGNGFLNKGARAIQQEKNIFQQVVLEKLKVHMSKKKQTIKPRHIPHTFKKINLEWVIDLNVNLLGENKKI